MKICIAINDAITVKLCGENGYNKFPNFKRLLKKTFSIYADFECIVVPTDNKIEEEEKKQGRKRHILYLKYQDQ